MRLNACKFCTGSRMHTCSSFSCRPAYDEAREYLEKMVAKEEVASGRRKYVTEVAKKGYGMEGLEDVDRAWLAEGSEKKELIIRFKPHIPGMQQAAYIEMIKKSLHALPEGAGVREWRKGDARDIEDGIPRPEN